jgi:hypothetical protein
MHIKQVAAISLLCLVALEVQEAAQSQSTPAPATVAAALKLTGKHETRDVTEFLKPDTWLLNLNGDGAEVLITEGEKNSVIIFADTALMPYITVKNRAECPGDMTLQYSYKGTVVNAAGQEHNSEHLHLVRYGVTLTPAQIAQLSLIHMNGIMDLRWNRKSPIKEVIAQAGHKKACVGLNQEEYISRTPLYGASCTETADHNNKVRVMAYHGAHAIVSGPKNEKVMVDSAGDDKRYSAVYLGNLQLAKLKVFVQDRGQVSVYDTTMQGNTTSLVAHAQGERSKIYFDRNFKEEQRTQNGQGTCISYKKICQKEGGKVVFAGE